MNIAMKAPVGILAQNFRDGTTANVDVNGILSVPSQFVSDCLASGYTIANSMGMLPNTSYKTRATVTTASLDLVATELAGGQLTVFRATGGTTPATSSVPTAAIMAALLTNMAIGDSYTFRLVNNDSGTIPAFAASTGWTFTGTMTVATNTFRDFQIIKTAAATFTMQSIGTGTDS